MSKRSDVFRSVEVLVPEDDALRVYSDMRKAGHVVEGLDRSRDLMLARNALCVCV